MKPKEERGYTDKQKEPLGMSTQHGSSLRKVDIGVLVAIALAVIAFAVFLGGLRETVRTLTDDVDTLAEDVGSLTRNATLLPNQVKDLTSRVASLDDKVRHLDPTRIQRQIDEGVALLKKLAGAVAPPLGVILPYDGKESFLRGTGWVMCDGSAVDEELLSRYGLVRTKVSDRFWGSELPDLRDRFVKGGSMQTALQPLVYEGSNNLPAHKHMQGLSVPDGGGHSHSGGDHSHPIPRNRPSGDTTATAATGGSGGNPTQTSAIATRGATHSHSGGNHAHSVQGIVGAPGVRVSGDGDDNQGSNQPAYMEVHFVILITERS